MRIPSSFSSQITGITIPCVISNFATKAGRTCLSWAAGNGHAACVYELVRYRLVAGLSGSLPLYRIEDEDGGGEGGGGGDAGKDDDAVSVKSSVSMREKFWFI